jgi:hypothetical protein
MEDERRTVSITALTLPKATINPEHCGGRDAVHHLDLHKRAGEVEGLCCRITKSICSHPGEPYYSFFFDKVRPLHCVLSNNILCQSSEKKRQKIG